MVHKVVCNQPPRKHCKIEKHKSLLVEDGRTNAGLGGSAELGDALAVAQQNKIAGQQEANNHSLTINISVFDQRPFSSFGSPPPRPEVAYSLCGYIEACTPLESLC